MNREWEKIGYLQENFKLFHLKDGGMRNFDWHYHDFHKILWLVSGKVHYHVEGKEYALQPYDILLIRKGEIHKPEVDFSLPYERYILYISEQYLTDRRWETDLDRCFEIAGQKSENLARMGAMDGDALLAVLKQLEESRKAKEFAEELYAEVLFLQFMIGLNRACLKSDCSVFGAPARFDKKVIEIVQYINNHLGEALTVDDLAEQFFISKYHMMRKFKEETGYSIHQYILEKRILKAKDMIINGVPATNACLECGFRDYSTFNRAFKSRLLAAPSELKEHLSRKNT